MAPPPSTAVPPFVSLIVRLLTAVCLIISLAILATNSVPGVNSDGEIVKIKFNYFYAYRYLLSAAVLGLVYTLLQSALNVLMVSTGNRIGGDSMLQFDFYGDKVLSYILATGTAAGFGLTVDFKRQLGVDSDDIDRFIQRAEAACGLCLIAFLFAAISSIFSSFSLPKRVV